MLFAHLADCHIGAWRDPRMKELPIRAFEEAVSLLLDRRVDFLLIAGDLFNTAIPPLDLVKRVVTQLQRLKEATIPVYAIAGSHDYSPSGKTMLDVLEEAGLLVNVFKGEAVETTDGQRLRLRFTTDPKTGVKITGILGRANSLDAEYYRDLDREALEATPGEKIFLFHASITELKPKSLAQMDSSPISLLPKGCNYYAGGHVHITAETSLDGYPNVVYPGPLFPANFSELESLNHGGLVLVKDWQPARVPIALKRVVSLSVDAEKKSAAQVNDELRRLAETDVQDAIVLLRAAGELADGRVSDLEFKQLLHSLEEGGAYAVMKNTAKLTSKEFEEFASSQHQSVEALEEHLIKEHVGQVPLGLPPNEEVRLTKQLLDTLGDEQRDGEKKYEYEERVVNAAKELLEKE